MLSNFTRQICSFKLSCSPIVNKRFTRQLVKVPTINFLVSCCTKFTLGFYLAQTRQMSTTFALSSPTISCKPVSFLNAENAKLIDLKLMAEPGFSIDQLMELAGYSVACAAHDFQITSNVLVKNKNILVFCGPGNNGGDGLVAARHLQHFGYKCTVVYPRRGKSYLFNNLVRQCDDLSIPVMDSISSSTYGDFGLIVDALFGFSFEGPPREPYAAVIRSLVTTTIPVLSVDVPSGWSVDEGDVHGTGLSPGAVISLSLPKRCMRGYKGVHYVGGRFIPPHLAEQLGVTLPDYGFGPAQIVRLKTDEETTGRGEVEKELPQSVKPEESCSDNHLESSGAVESAEEEEESEQVSIMFATASSIDEARLLARSLVEGRLAACVNLLPGAESVYAWRGEVETAQEVLLMIKTRKSSIGQVSAEIKRLHSYDLPESIALDAVGGSQEYLEWVRTATGKNGEEVV